MRTTLLLTGFFALALASCGEEELSPPVVDCTTAVVPTYAEQTIWATCLSCHNTALPTALRSDAPTDVNYNTYDAAKAHAKDGAAQVYGGRMPPAGKPQPSEAQKQAFYAWAMCGTPP